MKSDRTVTKTGQQRTGVNPARIQAERWSVKISHKLIFLFILALVSFVAIGVSHFGVMRGELDTGYLTSVIFIFGLLLIALLIYVGYGILRALMQIESTMTLARAGNLDARINLDSSDELGVLAKSINDLLNDQAATEAKVKQENAAILALLQGVYKFSQRDLTTRLEVTEDITAPLADSLNLMADETAKVLNGVVTIANEVALTSQQVKVQSDTVIKVASDERHEVEQAAAQLAEASEAMLNIAKLAKECNASADRAIRTTEKAQDTVLGTVNGITSIRNTIRETEKRIKRLGERSQEISRAVSLINSIAERTHILALNASMHAASAGEAGRGFAVVADEVQRLAENAREATSQITTLVNNIQAETADTVTTMNEAISQVVNGTQLAEQAGEQMQETRENTSDLVEKVQQIAESSNIQAQITRKLRERAEVIKQSTQKTNAELEDQSEKTDRLVQYSDGLLKAVSVFTLPEIEPKKDHKKLASIN
ncbi:MAG: hypothetical protein HY356_03140 [Gammaproteobacteria bacterium]|nr:hypothetical protein [Gammaproteobacteria bacterium]